MVGMGPEELSQHRVRSCVDPLRRGDCSRSGSGFAPDRLSYGTLWPLLSGSGMDHRHPWFLVGEPDPNSSRDCPDRRVGRLASHNGLQNEDRSPSRGQEIDSGLVPNEVRLVPVTAVNACVVHLERSTLNNARGTPATEATMRGLSVRRPRCAPMPAHWSAEASCRRSATQYVRNSSWHLILSS